MIMTLLLTVALSGEVEPLFTPGQDVETRLVQVIDSATRSVYVQAYGITSDKITSALQRAAFKGLVVGIILDKKSANWDGSDAEQLQGGGRFPRMYMRVDGKHTISHNKILMTDVPTLLVDAPNNSTDGKNGGWDTANFKFLPPQTDWDKATVVTGSFNFSDAAQRRNAENVVIITKDPATAKKYFKNWQDHWLHTDRYTRPEELPPPKPTTGKSKNGSKK